MHPGVLCLVLLAGVLIFLLPRKHLLIPLLAAALLIPVDQVVQVGPFHWSMLRVVILFGWMRVASMALTSRTPLIQGGLNAIDKAVMLWAGMAAVNIILLWQSSAALINQLGALYNVLGIYFLLRVLLQKAGDAERAICTLVGIAAVVAAVMLVEQATGEKLYVALRPAQEHARQMLWSRLGLARAVAGFGNPISAGVFGASVMPLSVGLWWRERRGMAVTGFCAGSLIVAASVSSTPVLAYAAAGVGLCLWPARRHLRLLRWSMLVALIGLHMSMQAPVWALIQRVGVIGGSSGYHRYILVDRFFGHFGDWWLIGTRDYGTWGYLSYDVANQYVGIGQSAGLIPLLLFIGVIAYAFQHLGKARQTSSSGNERRFLWALGCALLVHVVAFFGLSYFDQLIVAWYAVLAMIVAATAAGGPRGLKASEPRSRMAGMA